MAFGNNKISDKQQRFIECYCNPDSDTYCKVTKSYLKAGYSNVSSVDQCASRLLNSAKIKQGIELYKADKEKKQAVIDTMNREYTLNQIKDHLEHCIATGDNTNRSNMIGLLAKINGMLIDRKEIEQTNHNVANITPQELEALEAIARANNIRLSKKQG